MEVNRNDSSGRFTDRVIILTAIICVFLPAVLSLAAEAILTVSMIMYSQTRRIIFSSPLSLWLIPLAPAAIIPPIVHGNFVGIVAGAGLILLIILTIYFSRAMTSTIFEQASKYACVLSVIAMFVAVFERIIYSIWPHLSENKDLRCASVFFNPNLFGTVVVFIILLCLYKIMAGRGNKKIYTAIIAANLISMALCGSMLGMAELVVGIFFLLLFNRKWWGVGAFAAAAIAGVAAILVYPQLLPRIFEASESFNLRYRVWQLAIMMFRSAPFFGRGILTYMTFSPEYVGLDLGFNVWVTTCAHSLLLDSLLCLGIVGTAFLIGFMVHLYMPVVRSVVRKCDRAANALALAMTMGVLFHGLLDETIAWPQVTIIFLLILTGTATYGKKKVE